MIGRSGRGAGGAGGRRGAWRRAGLLVAVLVAGWSGPAAALMPPYVYEAARRDAASVIVITVQKVTPPQESFGACTVTGAVVRVERGNAHKPGQAVTIAVPCARPGASPPIGGTIWQPLDTLAKSHFGRAYLDAAGQVVLSQYEQLAAAP
ncbi:hypothetical protein V5F32_16170 [Xanthobacter oligotrophicus]|uniref:Uncharacterized protein n=1 Tax=Xanthobacter oligotrophicus TaxID=2607286 RepID=A0ABW7A109_9HYPH